MVQGEFEVGRPERMTGSKGARGRAVVVLGAAGLLLGLIGCGEEAPPKWTARSVQWTRAEGLVTGDGDGAAGQAFRAELLSSSNERSVSGFNMIAYDATFACRSVRIHVEDPHPLAGLLAEELALRLGDAIPELNHVLCVPHGHVPPLGGRAPDLELRVSLDGVPMIARAEDTVNVAASVRVIAQTGYFWIQGHCGRHGCAHVRDVTIEHRSTTRITDEDGVSVPELREPARAIATRHTRDLADHVRVLRAETNPPPRVPEGRDVSFLPTPEIAWPPGMKVVLSSRDFTDDFANVTTWSLDVGAAPSAPYPRLSAQLVSDGWTRVPGVEWRMLFRRGDLEWIVVSPRGWRRSGKPVERVEVRYFRSRAPERRRFLSEADFSDLDPGWLLTQAELFDDAELDRFFVEIRRRPFLDPRQWINLVSLVALKRREDQLSWILPMGEALAHHVQCREFEDVRKRYGTQAGLAKGAPLREEALRAIGVVDMKPGDSLSFDRDLGEWLFLRFRGPRIYCDGSLRVVPGAGAASGSADLRIERVCYTGTTWGTFLYDFDPSRRYVFLPEEPTPAFSVELRDDGRVRFRVEVPES